jgi:hypothetical protein
VLVTIEFVREEQGHQTLLLQDFLVLTNLTGENFQID